MSAYVEIRTAQPLAEKLKIYLSRTPRQLSGEKEKLKHKLVHTHT